MTTEKDETPFSRLQPYDTSFKALVDDVTLPLLSYLYREEITTARELKESLFKAVTEVRFPTLLELAQQRVRQARGSGDLRLVLIASCVGCSRFIEREDHWVLWIG